jgi:hypothetical protein
LSLNPYGQGNPLVKADPTGLFCMLIGLGSKVAAGATDSSGNGVGAAASESWSLAFCDGGRNQGLDSVGVVNTSAHFSSDHTNIFANLVEGLFAGFGVQIGVSLQAKQAEDLRGEATEQSVDMGFLWPVDLGIDWSHSDNPNIDVLTATIPGLSAGENRTGRRPSLEMLLPGADQAEAQSPAVDASPPLVVPVCGPAG